MTDIPNTKYTTIQENGIFVGGEPATHYSGYHAAQIMDYFQKTQLEIPNLLEIYALTSGTQVDIGRPGKPVPQDDAANHWLSVKMKDGFVGPWVQGRKGEFADMCAFYCAEYLYKYNWMRYAAFGFHYPIPEIPNTEYITVKRDDDNKVDIFIGNQKAETYHGLYIVRPEEIKENFALAQSVMPQIEELHALSSETKGRPYLPGIPSVEPGCYTYCRIKFRNKPVNFAPWVCYGPYNTFNQSTHGCIKYCANVCAYSLQFPGMVEVMSDRRFIKNPDKNSPQKIIEAQTNFHVR